MTIANLQLILSENYSTCRYVDVFLMCLWWGSWVLCPHTLPSLSPLWVKDFFFFPLTLFWIYHASPSSLQSFCISKVLWDSLVCKQVALILFLFRFSFLFTFFHLTIMFLSVTSSNWSCLGFSVLPGLGCLFSPRLGNVSAVISSNKFSTHFFFCSPFGPHNANVSTLDVVAAVS